MTIAAVLLLFRAVWDDCVGFETMAHEGGGGVRRFVVFFSSSNLFV